jgi:hypothetical protein
MVNLRTTNDVNRIEAPVTWKAYLMCAFASFGGIFFGYDSGYINGVNGSKLFIHQVEGPTATALSTPHTSLITSILSAGTFFGAVIAGDVAERIGRKWTVIIGCLIYLIGVIVQMITGPGVDALGTIVAGRIIAGLGVGFESAIVILYMSEIVRHYYPASVYLRANKFCSAQRRSAVRLSQVTNSPLPSVSSWHPSLSTPRKTEPTPAHTAFRLPFNSRGPSFSALD